VVIVLAIGPKVCGFKPGSGQWAFKGDKNRSTTSLVGEENLAGNKVLRHVENPYSMKEILVGKIHGYASPFSLALLLGVSAGYCQRALVGE
jgi:hypothetical protein